VRAQTEHWSEVRKIIPRIIYEAIYFERFLFVDYVLSVLMVFTVYTGLGYMSVKNIKTYILKILYRRRKTHGFNVNILSCSSEERGLHMSGRNKASLMKATGLHDP